MLREVLTLGAWPAGAAGGLTVGVPFWTIAHGPAAAGAVPSLDAHPASTNATPVSGTITLVRDEFRIT